MRPKAAGIRPRPWFCLRRTCVTACISGLLFVAPLRAQDAQEKVSVDDVSRTFTVHLPKGYDSQQHYPVVILLHGRNQDADDMARLTHFNQLADKDGIIAVYPNAVHGEWNIGVRPEQPSTGMARRGGGRRGGWLSWGRRRLSRRWRRLSRRWRWISGGRAARRTKSRRDQEQA